MLYEVWESVREVALVTTVTMWALYVACAVALALAIVAGIVATILALIPDREPPAAGGRDARP